ncbi:helix-turn-helix domain-containing protein [Streptomyces bauhiniae]|uniref:XRE family transcriptional regulator n=1 Tax=Streptomyces bauhiniae TaxID=2340725 RepID=A0A4Z1D9S5_9ACTN|nr:helix-turn-helix transcriptional regulator [Streptomyces bauhiniae]TGN79379.1 XRE family transcriptional regulator [Streptomyces bauhiniae]
MSRQINRSELGQFLKARRSELSPSAVGLPETGTLRRVPGLRREEVAQLASISAQYYTRLEQGRLQASAPVLTILAGVLRLDDGQRDYLFELAGKENTRPRRQKDQKVRPSMQRLLESLTDIPAMVLGRRMDILAWNSLASALITDFSRIPQEQRNYVRLIFSDSTVRSRYVDWESMARDCVAFLRMEAARNPDDPRLTALVGELSVKDPHFRQWWAGHHVAHRAFGTKAMRHPVAGDLILDWETLSSAGDPDQQLTVWTAEPGTPSYDGLRFLASWSATDRTAPRQSGTA